MVTYCIFGGDICPPPPTYSMNIFDPYIIVQQVVYDTKKYSISTYILKAHIMHQASVEYFGCYHKTHSKLLKTTIFVYMRGYRFSICDIAAITDIAKSQLSNGIDCARIRDVLHESTGLYASPEINMAHLCIHEPTKRNTSKPSENTNHPPTFVVSTKSMFQLVSTCDIIGRVQVIYLLVFCRYCGIINYKITMLKTILAVCFYANG